MGPRRAGRGARGGRGAAAGWGGGRTAFNAPWATWDAMADGPGGQGGRIMIELQGESSRQKSGQKSQVSPTFPSRRSSSRSDSYAIARALKRRIQCSLNGRATTICRPDTGLNVATCKKPQTAKVWTHDTFALWHAFVRWRHAPMIRTLAESSTQGARYACSSDPQRQV